MKEQNSHLAPEATTSTEAASNERRAALKQSGLLIGAALLGGFAKTQSAQADENGTMMKPGMMAGNMMQPGMMNAAMFDEKMQAHLMAVTNMTSRNEKGIPKNGVIAPVTTPSAKDQNDIGILNYALALEYLEADFYTRVVQADEARSYLRGRVKDIARILMRDETTHVQAVSDAIRALGGTPISKPDFVFPEDAFISPIGFLQLSSQLEETGVSAYLGQGAHVSRKDVLNFAASIYGNEARHAGLIKHYLGDPNAHNMEMPLSMAEVGMKVKPFFANPQMIPASLMQS
jgi:hypothetical protein